MNHAAAAQNDVVQMWGEKQVNDHGLLSRYWHSEGEFTTLAGLAFDADTAAHLLDETRRNRIAQPRPGL